MSLKDKVKGLRIVRRCWTMSDDEAWQHTKEDCVRDGCPYAETQDCDVQAIIDACDVVEKLWRKLKKERKKNVERGTDERRSEG